MWGFFHEPETYHDPMTLKPERFLSDNDHITELDPHTMVFGFGVVSVLDDTTQTRPFTLPSRSHCLYLT
ncbi:hypothetical protein DTO021D3_1065 [Paecilomyces variotii]|nr:hypothetical protein DTO032I3_906 [Paecilomyces variotii]KAJ9282313.1 hypothetical protein DTO021D3_1065 [Paecilomyces variotii]KAJ9343629.1 hypothetical protein DTO027B6_3847 [Paecilomyces variotii]KAJ9351044.1 hypothetical protein DTO027B9_6629 [Paecilomyces variotii]KAJ9383100.1 hypothetical protein DTO032I4_5367 [Paecilomyces variotii]